MNQKYIYLIFFFCFQILTESFGYQVVYNAVPVNDLVGSNYSPKLDMRAMNIVDRLSKRNSEPAASSAVVVSTNDSTAVNTDLQRALFEKLFGVKSLFIDIVKTLFGYVSSNIHYFKQYVKDLPTLTPDKTLVSPLTLLGPLYEILKLLTKAIFTQ